MTYKLRGVRAKAFQEIALNSALHQLSPLEQDILCALLETYVMRLNAPPSPLEDEDYLEIVACVVAEGARFGEKLQSVLFTEPSLLSAHLARFKDLPKRLMDLAEVLGPALDRMGKRGHKREVSANYDLIVASEFVRLITGTHHDERLAELFQALFDRPLELDLSGDAIRKKRKYFKKYYPHQNASALQMAEELHRDRKLQLDLCSW